MKQLRKIIFVCAFFAALAVAGATEPSLAPESGASAAGGHAEAGRPLVSADAPTLFQIGPLPVTNSMVFTWIVGAVIFLVVRLGTRRMSEVPPGTQNIVETTVEGLEDLAAGILEPKVTRWVFPLVATYFIFILAANLTGLLPGVGSIGSGNSRSGQFVAVCDPARGSAAASGRRPPTPT